MRSVHTDLAMEAWNARRREHEGVIAETIQRGEILETTVQIRSAADARSMGKPCGEYITLECAHLPQADAPLKAELVKTIGEKLTPLLPQEGDILLIGLGNRYVSADALGNRVLEKVLVTRHLKETIMPSLQGKLRGVSAVAPGVLGMTGVETAEIVKGLVEHTHPSCVIAVDALAAMKCQRICTTIQITDTGIQPGSGVGNHRLGLTHETLGVPVIAIGVPMVVYAATIAADAMALVMEGNDSAGIHKPDDENSIFHRLMQGPFGDLIVTPREVDELVNSLSALIAAGINLSIHPYLTEKEITCLMH